MSLGSSRRSFMKLAAAAPLFSQIAAQDLYAQAARCNRQGAAAKHICQAGSQNHHQLPGHLDVPEWFAGISRSPSGPGGGSAAFRQCDGVTAWCGTTAC